MPDLAAVMTGGAICVACHAARPFEELLAFVPVRAGELQMDRLHYVCRPSLNDMRFALCTSRALASADQHAIALATDVERLRRQASLRARPTRPALPEHLRNYEATVAA
jgi:hypothetical protein